MNASERLNRARQLASDGHFAEALAEHEWFHHNALAEEPALRGVRRSFALSYWAELGQNYAPALQALTELRDRNYTALLGGTGNLSLFADLAAINRYLHDEPNTYRLFVALDARDSQFAATCFGSAIEAVVGAPDLPLARKYIPNPEAALSGLLRDFNESVALGFRLADKRRQARRLQAEASNFISDVRLLLTVVRSTDGEPVAARLARASIAGVSSELVRKRVARKIAA